LFELKMIMVEEIVQLAAVLDSENDSSFPVHLLQGFLRVFIHLCVFEEPIEKQAEKKSRLMVKNIRVIDFFPKSSQRRHSQSILTTLYEVIFPFRAHGGGNPGSFCAAPGGGLSVSSPLAKKSQPKTQ
jgi:hypothetical protein